MANVKCRRLLVRTFLPVAALTAAMLLSNPAALRVAATLPPRPTPAVTPLPTSTPLSKPVRKTATAATPLAHIRLVVTPPQAGLWTGVQWQGADGAWHTVDGWQGTLAAGVQRWAVLAQNFGEGPFRWVVYEAAGGAVLGSSAPFQLPRADGEEVLVTVKLNP